jgi:ribosomal protein S27AE
VLALDVDGRELVVEVAEVLPQFVCPSCAKIAAMGHRRSQCPRCGLTGWLGEPLPAVGVALDAAGRARWFTIESGREAGEAIHRLHAELCATSRAPITAGTRRPR